MIKNRFIVLIDFSPYSAPLLQFAYQWSTQVGAEILLVNQTVVSAPFLAGAEAKQEIASIAKNKALIKLKELAHDILSRETAVKYLVSEESVLAVLPGILQEPFNNLIFLGLKGAGIRKQIFIGSVAVDVIDNINNLKVLLPQSCGEFSCESILVAVQKETPLNTAEFDKFLEFTQKLKHIIFFSVVDEAYERFDGVVKYLKELKELYSNRANTSYELYQGAVAIPTLKEVVAQKKNQFVVIQKGSRMFHDPIFKKFLINELAHEGKTPLIVVP